MNEQDRTSMVHYTAREGFSEKSTVTPRPLRLTDKENVLKK